MASSAIAIVGFLILLSRNIYGTHFLGGTITWKSLNQSATGSPVAIVITQTYLFTYATMQCTNAMIMSNSFVPNYLGLASSRLQCVTNCATGAVGYTNVSVIPRCTDFSVAGDIIVGQRSDTVYLQTDSNFSASFISSAWRPLTTIASGFWAISTRINVDPRSDNGLYNNAPVATMMSPINLPVNKTMAIHIPVADADGDTVRCRWASKSNGVDECSDVCPPGSLPSGTVIFPNCTIIITGRNIGDAFAVAIMVEDFVNSTSTTPLSSVPVQFLVQVVNTPSCTTPPEVVGIPPEDSCTSVIVGQTYTSQLIAVNNCGANVSITDIATLSFAGVIQSNIIKQDSTTYYKSLSWMPSISQLGYQVMCSMAVDSQQMQSAQYCFNFYVSFNDTNDCPGKIALATITSTTSSTSSTTSMTSTTSSTTTEMISSTSALTSFASTPMSSTTNISSISFTTSATTNNMSTLTSISSTPITNTTISAATTVRKNDGVNWQLYGTIIGLSILAALLLCWCFCGLYLCPSIDSIPRYATDDKPVLYSIEQNADFDCCWSDTYSSLDTSIGPYMNVDRSCCSPSRSSDNASTPTISDSNNDFSSMVPSNRGSNVPLTHVFLPRLRILLSENNTCIKSRTYEVIDEQNYIPHRLQTKNIVRISRIKPAPESQVYVHSAFEKIRRGRVNDPVNSSSHRSSHFVYVNKYNKSEPTLYSSSNDRLLRTMSDERETSTEFNRVGLRHRTVQSISSLPSVGNRIRVERKPIRKRKVLKSIHMM